MLDLFPFVTLALGGVAVIGAALLIARETARAQRSKRRTHRRLEELRHLRR